MKHLYLLLFSAFAFGLSSCKKDNGSGDNSPTFQFTSTSNNISEGDNVTFYLNTTNAYISNTVWYINDIQTESPSTLSLEKTFVNPGNYVVKVVINYQTNNSTPGTKTLEQNVTVAARPSTMVKINKIQIMAMDGGIESGFRRYVNTLGYYFWMANKFEVWENDPSTSTQTLKYVSDVNSMNYAGHVILAYPIVWDMSSANYKVKVYTSSNLFPNGQNNYHTHIQLMGAGYGSPSIPGPYTPIAHLYLDLNPYKSLRPATLDLNVDGVQVKLDLVWN